MATANFKLAECIDEARAHKRIKASAFLGSESGIFFVGLRMGQIGFLVRHVEVAARDHRLLLL